MTACPECAGRSWLCFEHNEAARAREDDAETLALFAARWEARLDRERAFAEQLAKDAWFFGRRVAKGELLLERAQALLAAKAEALDDTMPIYAHMLPFEVRERIVAESFAEGQQSVRKLS